MGIVVLHVGIVALALLMKGPTADASADTPPIQVVMFKEPEQARPREIPVEVPEITPPQVVMPLINIEIPLPPPTIAMVATPTPPPPPLPPPPVRVEDPDSPVSISQADWVRMPSPVYPAAAKRARAQGVVLVRALVDTSGHALKAIVHRSSGFAALDRAACDSVLAALFRPYLHNGVPRSVDVIVPVTFALKGRGADDRGPPRGRDRDEVDLQLDVRGENHHAMRGHAEEPAGLGAAAQHAGE